MGSHTVTFVTHPVGDGEIAQPARRGRGRQGSYQGPVEIPAAKAVEAEEAKEGLDPGAERDEQEVGYQQEGEDHEKHRHRGDFQHPFDSPPKERSRRTTSMSRAAIHWTVVASASVGRRPVALASTVEAAAAARAGQPRCTRDSRK